ncbi:LacI family DNA-binding transcriptional regulator [Bifidobacterium saguinibicoloris]|uniref:LacI family DNA-binding transcriptional regulator n=1 Tax=Bifidobacterium saguinibicoloris TaxID=2834433 RepID=UPI001C592D09|nr:LacI family DNA-binding transcriptional regulator [Bifidobacterium saguinibicoloris]MBW3080754.1 LacI family DNA-binding transcriptional regulator [Bifidobacterium saguinibicoloris]
MGRVTIMDVAHRAGVSRGTVSNYLNHPEKLSTSKREAIAGAIAQLGFVPNRNASILAGGANPAIGLVVTGYSHASTAGIATGVQRVARANDLDLFVAGTDNDGVLTDRYLDYFQGSQMVGMLIVPYPSSTWTPHYRLSIPTVVVDYLGDGSKLCSVAADNRKTGRLAARHLIELGRRRIMVVAPAEDIQSAHERCLGIGEVVAEHPGIGVEWTTVEDCNGEADGMAVGEALAHRDPVDRPDAVIAITDATAIGVIKGLMAAGVDVPGQVAVMGCEGNTMTWDGPMPLTTIAPQWDDMGVAAAELLVGEIRGDGAAHRHRARVVDSRLLVRESTVGRAAGLEAMGLGAGAGAASPR